MLHLYVLYACMHLMPRKHAPQPGPTQCVESRVFFHAEQCRKQLPKDGGLTQKSKDARSWLECVYSVADSWIPRDPTDGVSRLYQAAAGTADESAVAALLSPLPAQARAVLGTGTLKQPFQRTFRGPGELSFFVVGTGSSVAVFAVSHLDDFQFADVAADVSSSSAALTDQGNLDFASIAEYAGIQLGYHTEKSQRAMPPPGGMATSP